MSWPLPVPKPWKPTSLGEQRAVGRELAAEGLGRRHVVGRGELADLRAVGVEHAPARRRVGWPVSSPARKPPGASGRTQISPLMSRPVGLCDARSTRTSSTSEPCADRVDVDTAAGGCPRSRRAVRSTGPRRAPRRVRPQWCPRPAHPRCRSRRCALATASVSATALANRRRPPWTRRCACTTPIEIPPGAEAARSLAEDRNLRQPAAVRFTAACVEARAARDVRRGRRTRCASRRAPCR